MRKFGHSTLGLLLFEGFPATIEADSEKRGEVL